MGTTYKRHDDNKKEQPGSKANQGAGYVGKIPIWYKPWILQDEYTKGSKIQTGRINLNIKRTVSTAFTKDDYGSMLLQATIGLAGAVTVRSLIAGLEGTGWKIVEELNTGIGDAAGAFMAFTAVARWELQVSQEEVIATQENWYGKVRYNGITGDISAVKYYGSSKTDVIIQRKRTERIVDSKTNAVIATRVYNYPIITDQSASTLPKRSYGKFR